MWVKFLTSFLVAIESIERWWQTATIKKAGKDEADAESMRATLDDVERAKAARERLHTDPTFAKRVRDLFTRK